MNRPLTDPDELKQLLGIPFTPEQMACITAPLAPQVIVAGAGSGKTTVMAARVVWLVGTGQVAPDEVLGLTFTNKAAGELSERVRTALVRAGSLAPDGAGAGVGSVRPGEAGGGARSGEASPEVAEEAVGEPRISTYHAFAGRLLDDHGLRMGLDRGTRLLADTTRFQLAARVLRGAPGPYPALTKSLPALVDDLLALDAELAEHLVPPERLRAYDTELLSALDRVRLGNADLRKVPEAARARLELLDLVGAYRELKRKHGLLDFGDQIALSATLALEHSEVGRILREEFAVVLLDEYQDTSVAQRMLLAALFGEGTGHAVTAVGDPCQAIYGWRGASVANLDDFPHHFPQADRPADPGAAQGADPVADPVVGPVVGPVVEARRPAERYALSENRRSGGRLLDLANDLAAPLRSLHAGVAALRPAPGAERDGTVRCALLPTHAEELAWLADSIAHLVRTGTAPGEIAVLCRTAGDFGEIQGALVEREVPVEVVGLSGLLHLPEVADLVAMCEVLQDPTANAALVRLLVGPRWRIGPRDLALLGRRARVLVRRDGPAPGGDPAADGAQDLRLAEAVEGVDPSEVVSLADALDTFLAADGADDGLPFSPEARVRFARFAAELRDLRRSLADPLMDVLHRVLATTGLEVELSASPHALAARRRETLGNFLDIAARFAANQGDVLGGEPTLLAFLGFLRTAVQHEKGLDNALPGGENTVKVLTAHKAKGLEWDVVAVPGLVAGQFPSGQAREAWTSGARVLPHALRGDAATLPDVGEWDGKGLAAFRTAMKDHQATEELRLGYVAFTRPRSLLLGSGHWWGPSQKRPRGPSAFLEALREHCERGHGEVEAWAEPPEDGAENPALARSVADRPWPLPLDAAALRLRRRAAQTVLAHLAECPGGGDPGKGEGTALERDGLPGARAHPGSSADRAASTGADRTGPPAHTPLAYGGSANGGLTDGDSAYGGSTDGGSTAGGSANGGSTAGGSANGASAGFCDLCGSDGTRSADDCCDTGAPGGPEGVARQRARAGGVPRQTRRLARADGRPAVPGDRDPGPEPGLHEAPDPLAPEEARAAASWDRDLDALEGELRRARATVRDVPLPASLSASQLLHLAADPDGFARDLARPMPRPPQPAARRGTRFHAWVESRFEELPLPFLGPDELPGGLEDDPPDASAEIADERDLAALKAAFERTPYADRTPYRIEAPFQLTLAGRVIRGRIDAVYRDPAPGPDGTGVAYEIVDWKTGRGRSADPLQLAIYRLAWAEQQDVPLSSVSAAFLYVRSGEIVRPAGLPGRAVLERLLTDDVPAGSAAPPAAYAAGPPTTGGPP